MNDTAFEKKVNRDVDKVKKDIETLGDDGVTGLNRKFVQLADDAKKSVGVSVKTLNKEVGQRLKQYNSAVQDAADRVPGNFSKKAAGYPWVTISLSLVIGLVLGLLLKPGQQQPVG